MNIVIAQNERPESRRALDWIIDNGPLLAGTASDQLKVHVVLASSADSPASPNYASPILGDSIASELTALKLAFTVYPAGADAAAQLLEVAETVSADLIVIGMRKRSVTMKLLLGSQIQRVMIDARCPVVTVKPTTD